MLAFLAFMSLSWSHSQAPFVPVIAWECVLTSKTAHPTLDSSFQRWFLFFFYFCQLELSRKGHWILFCLLPASLVQKPLKWIRNNWQCFQKQNRENIFCQFVPGLQIHLHHSHACNPQAAINIYNRIWHWLDCLCPFSCWALTTVCAYPFPFVHLLMDIRCWELCCR